MKSRIFLIIILLFASVIRLYRLPELPGEWFGDISNVHEYVLEILEGKWPFYFLQSAGPIYFYLIVPIVKITGTKYIGYKIASAFVSLLSLTGIYFFSKEFGGRKFALISVFVASISFWHIIWSRIGNLQILIPFLVSVSFYFVLKSIRNPEAKNVFPAMIIASTGLFVYPASFVLSFTVFTILVFGFLFHKKLGKNKGLIGAAFLILLFGFFIFIVVVVNQPENFLNGYMGEKLVSSIQLTKVDLFYRYIKNLFKTVLMFHGQGDNIFRVNVPNAPQIDRISGIFIIIGILYGLYKRTRKYLILILISFFFFIQPSILPTISEREIPNSSRVIGVMPLVLIVTAFGMFAVYKYFKNLGKIYILPVALLFTVTAYLNFNQYFVKYQYYLPDHNVSFSTIIVSYIDSLPKETKILLTDCCWAQAGQPEPKAIYYSLTDKTDRFNIVKDAFIKKCEDVVDYRPVVLVMSPRDQQLSDEFSKCFKYNAIKESHYYQDVKVFDSIYLPE